MVFSFIIIFYLLYIFLSVVYFTHCKFFLPLVNLIYMRITDKKLLCGNSAL